MRQMPTLTSHMHPFPWAVDVTSSPAEALTEMARHNIHHLPVKSGNEVVGLVSAPQLQTTVVAGEPVSSLAPYCNAETPKFQTHDTLDKVLTYLIEHNQHAVIVMKEEKLAGIYTSHDALVHLRKLLRELYPEDDNAA